MGATAEQKRIPIPALGPAAFTFAVIALSGLAAIAIYSLWAGPHRDRADVRGRGSLFARLCGVAGGEY
ncbi:MAG: hypothetical protein CL814_02265 [Confluentimicrobium sp.]|uniref:hypothetical protein n=1 Tax=Actibacterium sp. TaxID=1872125 RepID=UPI000C36C593|nr:hypothetical protein [Actibacterium sp.]MBC55738.1 hypothetical protein [Actibacterium sp.]|tara:strand:- start:758 stop:961 length:204 start_codon:yes stop_codon:yes gene_type:complete